MRGKGHSIGTYSYSVYPHYSCGSPAVVDARTAANVAADERRGYEATPPRIYGREQHERAMELGLTGIVELHYTRAHHIELTGERGRRKNGERFVQGEGLR